MRAAKSHERALGCKALGHLASGGSWRWRIASGLCEGAVAVEDRVHGLLVQSSSCEPLARASESATARVWKNRADNIVRVPCERFL